MIRIDPLNPMPEQQAPPPEPDVSVFVTSGFSLGGGLPDAEPGQTLQMEGAAARRRERKGWLSILDPPKKRGARFVVIEVLKSFRFPNEPRREPTEPGQRLDMDNNSFLDSLVARGAAKIVAEIQP